MYKYKYKYKCIFEMYEMYKCQGENVSHLEIEQ